jgi:hypothetical protein
MATIPTTASIAIASAILRRIWGVGATTANRTTATITARAAHLRQPSGKLFNCG